VENQRDGLVFASLRTPAITVTALNQPFDAYSGPHWRAAATPRVTRPMAPEVLKFVVGGGRNNQEMRADAGVAKR
jgi:hypothetical protein